MAEAPPVFQRLPQERTKLIGWQAQEKGDVSGEKAVKNGLSSPPVFQRLPQERTRSIRLVRIYVLFYIFVHFICSSEISELICVPTRVQRRIGAQHRCFVCSWLKPQTLKDTFTYIFLSLDPISSRLLQCHWALSGVRRPQI
jgi:hypothetical protein